MKSSHISTTRRTVVTVFILVKLFLWYQLNVHVNAAIDRFQHLLMKPLLLIWNISIIMSRVSCNWKNTSLICILSSACGGLTRGISESSAAEWFIISSSWLLCVSAERSVGFITACWLKHNHLMTVIRPEQGSLWVTKPTWTPQSWRQLHSRLPSSSTCWLGSLLKQK